MFFFESHAENEAGKLVPTLFLFFKKALHEVKASRLLLSFNINLLTDLSKAFDCLPHSLLTAKLKAYGFDNNSFNLVNDYLSHRFQKD